MMTTSTRGSRPAAFLVLFLATYASALDLVPFWDSYCGAPSYVSPASSAEIILLSCGEKVTAFDFHGNHLWSYDAGGAVRSVSASENVLVGLDDSAVLIGRGGAMVWSAPLNHSVQYVVQSDGGFVVSGGKAISFVDGSGSVAWRYEMPWDTVTSPVIGSPDMSRVVVGSSGTLYALSLPPHDVKSYPAEGTIVHDPVIVGSSVVFATSSGKVYSLALERGFRLEWVRDVGSRIVSGPYVLRQPGNDSLMVAGSGSMIELDFDGGIRRTSTMLVGDTPLQPITLQGSEYLMALRGGNLTLYKGMDPAWSHRFIPPLKYASSVSLSGNRSLLLAVDSSFWLHALSTEDEITRSLGDEYLAKAKEDYDKGDKFGVAAYVELAKAFYNKSGDREKVLEADDILLRLRADELYAIGKVYFDFGYYNISSSYAVNASRIYSQVGDAKGVSESTTLLNKSGLHEVADTLMDKAVKEYISRNLELSEDYALEAQSLYGALNSTEDAADSKRLAEEAVLRGRADYYYRLSVKYYFNDTMPGKAADFLNRSSAIYSELNDTRGLEITGLLSKRILADESLAKARSYSSLGLGEKAKEEAESAARLYSDVGYDIGVSKARSAVPKTEEKGGGGLLYAFAAFVVVSAFAASYLLSRRKTS